MLESGSSGSVRGVLSNEHPYRDRAPQTDLPSPRKLDCAARRPCGRAGLVRHGARDYKSMRHGSGSPFPTLRLYSSGTGAKKRAACSSTCCCASAAQMLVSQYCFYVPLSNL